MSNLRPRHVRGNTALDVILKAFLKNNLESLSQEHKDILERISEVDARIRVGYTVSEPRISSLTAQPYIHSYKRPYRKKELAEWQVSRFGVSLSQAYIDVEMAERFFLTTERRPDKEFARGIMIHWGEDAMAKAISEGDFRAAAAFFKELNKIKGLDREDVPEFDPEKFMPIQPIIVADPSELGFDKIDNVDLVVSNLNKDLRKSKMMDRLLKKEAEEIDFEEEESDNE